MGDDVRALTGHDPYPIPGIPRQKRRPNLTTMTTDFAAAEAFVFTHARLLERQRLSVLLYNDDLRAVLTTLAAYQDDDGGFGQAFEPDVRGPHSGTTATLTALELLDAFGALDRVAARLALRWVGTIARSDGGLLFGLPAAAHAPTHPRCSRPTRDPTCTASSACSDMFSDGRVGLAVIG